MRGEPASGKSGIPSRWLTEGSVLRSRPVAPAGRPGLPLLPLGFPLAAHWSALGSPIRQSSAGKKFHPIRLFCWRGGERLIRYSPFSSTLGGRIPQTTGQRHAAFRGPAETPGRISSAYSRGTDLDPVQHGRRGTPWLGLLRIFSLVLLGVTGGNK